MNPLREIRGGPVAILLLLLLVACGAESADPTPTDGPERSPALDSPTAATPTAAPTRLPATATAVPTGETAQNDLFPDVVAVEIEPEGEGRYTFHVTLSSPYDSPARYADGWRVVDPSGTVLGERILLHDHASEQPFTRSLAGVAIPADVEEVTVQGRDQLSGYGGAAMVVPVPRP